jgi:hypothetical protein
MTIDERADALIVTAPLLARRRAAVLAVATIVVFAFLAVNAFSARGQRSALDAIGMCAVFGGCGYLALILALDRNVTTVRRDRIVVRHGPIPMWPAITIDAAHVEDVRATVATGIVGRGGRMVLDSVTASLVGGRSVTLVDDAGDTAAAEEIAATITTWLWSHRE